MAAIATVPLKQSAVQTRTYPEAAVIAVATAIFFGCLIAPPALMDDVDAVHGQLSRNMLVSGDWTIAHLNGVPYMEKAPLLYWLMAICYRVFGVHDWSARIPIALATVLLCWVTARYPRWAFGKAAGFYARLVSATCVGLFLFTRILIPHVLLTLAICVSFWSFQRALEPKDEDPHSRRWARPFSA